MMSTDKEADDHEDTNTDIQFTIKINNKEIDYDIESENTTFDKYYLLDKFDEKILQKYYLIGVNIYASSLKDCSLDELPARDAKISNHVKIYKNIFENLSIVKKSTNKIRFDDYVKSLSRNANIYDDINLIPINYKNKISLFKDKIIEWLLLHNIQCYNYNIDIISNVYGVITRNCLLDRILQNANITDVKFNYFKNIKIIIKTRGTICHKPLIELNFKPDDNLQTVIHNSLFTGFTDILNSKKKTKKLREKYLNYYDIYYGNFEKINYTESHKIKLKDIMKNAGGNLYLNQTIYDLEPVFIKSEIHYPNYIDYFEHIYASEFTINDYTKYIIDPLFKNFDFGKKGNIKLIDINKKYLNLSFDDYIKKNNISNRNIILIYKFTKKVNKTKKKKKVVKQNVSKKSINTILQELLDEFGTIDDCILNEKKINCKKWNNFTVKHNNKYNIYWNINNKKKVKCDDSKIKISLNIPLRMRY